MADKEAEPLMSPAEMKPLLALSKRQPVNAAFCLSKEKDAVLLLDKKVKPRKLMATLKKMAKEAGIELDNSTVRFGHCEVDKDEDARQVNFVVNKESPGALRVKLLPLIRKAGFGKVEITVDEGLETAPEDESDTEDSADVPAATAAPADPAAAPAQAAAPAGQDPAGAAQPGAAQGGQDVATVAKRMTDLVKRMMGALGSNPAGADAMKTAAMAGQAAIKAGDAAAISAAADTLERLLGAASAGGPGGAAPANAPKNGVGSPIFGKARATWVSTRAKIESDLEKLHKALQDTYKGHGVVADLEKVFRSKVEPMLGKLDHSLSDKLDEVSQTTDPQKHADLVGEARKIISDYESYLSSEPLIAQLDGNPFTPLAIRKNLTDSLKALSMAVA